MTRRPPKEVLRIQGVGHEAHGLVEWQECFIMLDSEGAALVALHPATGDVDELWKVRQSVQGVESGELPEKHLMLWPKVYAYPLACAGGVLENVAILEQIAVLCSTDCPLMACVMCSKHGSAPASSAGVHVVQTCYCQVPETGMFLKGLTVLDDVAYFGITPSASRATHGSADTDAELAAFDLMNHVLLWRRQVTAAGGCIGAGT